MKKLLGVFSTVCFAAAMMVGTTGCPGKDAKAKKNVTATADPATVDVVAGGDAKTVTLTFKHGELAKKEIKLTVDNGGKDKGVSADLDKADLGDKDTVGKLNVKASATATAGDYTITVKGTSTDSEAFSATVKVKVKAAEAAKEGKKNSVEATSSPDVHSIEQGGKAEVKVTVKRGADVAKASVVSAKVMDKEGKMEAKGVTATVANNTVDKATGDAVVTVAAMPDAAPGEYSLQISVATVGGDPEAVPGLKAKITVTEKKKG